MGLESATYIDDLVTTNPLGTDTIPQGDDHIRLVKTVLKNTIKGASRAFYLPSTTSSQTSTVTVATTDQNKLIPVDASSAAITVDLPQGSTLPDGFEVEIVKTDHTANLVTVDAYSSETINGYTTYSLWQSYQTMKLRYSSSLSAWIAKREYIPPKGEVTQWTATHTGAGGTGVPDGWLYPNGTTIGDASSSATQRANADCQGLFYHLWNNFDNTRCPVSTGRGASASADWAAHKTITLINLAGTTWVGLDNLGGISDRGLLTNTGNGAGTAGQTNGEVIGDEGVALTLAQLPSEDLSHSLTPSDPFVRTQGSLTVNSSNDVSLGGSSTRVTSVSLGAAVTGNSITGTISLGGSDAEHSNVQPSFVSGWKIKI